MNNIYTNACAKTSVIAPFVKMASVSNEIYLAAPYFTRADMIIEEAEKEKSIKVITCLNSITSPKVLSKLMTYSNVKIRYFTDKFHAKVFIFDEGVLLGSSNLTEQGLFQNREAVIQLLEPKDGETIQEIRSFFNDLWKEAESLDPTTLDIFTKKIEQLRSNVDNDYELRKIFGDIYPPINKIGANKKKASRLYLSQLKREIFEEYKPAFDEIAGIMRNHSIRRTQNDEMLSHEVNRFLSWLRVNHIPGDIWKEAQPLLESERKIKVCNYGKQWAAQKDTTSDHWEMYNAVRRVFSSEESIEEASTEQFMEGLMSVHAFLEQYRFVSGGESELSKEFLKRNEENIVKIKKTISSFLFGQGLFLERLHDILYEERSRLKLFGRSCSLELYGTVKPEECPPMNNRIAKALRFLGYTVVAR